MATTSKSISCAFCGKFIAWEITHKLAIGGDFSYRESTEKQRSDKVFCDDVCGAAYHRENGTASVHADLPKEIVCICEYCGAGYTINEYALRAGKRAPKFCSTKCRVRAHREKHKSVGRY